MLQELVRFYIIKKGVRSIRTTVLIDTQARIVLLGTQTSPFLVSGTLAMAVAEICLRSAKAALIARLIHRRARILEENLQPISTDNVDTKEGGPSVFSLN